MVNLYQLIEDSECEIENQGIKRIEILYDLQGNSYNIKDSHFCKRLLCVSGSCELDITRGNLTQTVLLNSIRTIEIDKNVIIKLSNYSSKTKVIVLYRSAKNE